LYNTLQNSGIYLFLNAILAFLPKLLFILQR